MTAAPLVSVIVPCFNGAAWLRTAVESVLAQGIEALELIVSDDGSTDGSLDLARALAAGDRRIVVRAEAVNRGMTANWNAGLAAARGRYVCKLDCDDAWRPGTLAVLLDAYARAPELTAAFCRTLQCDAALRPLGPWLGERAFARRGVDPGVDAVRPAADWYEWCFDDVQLWHSNAFLLRRDLLCDRLGGWDERYGCAADTDLILRLLELGGAVAHRGHVGVCYRDTPGSVSAHGRRAGWVALEGQLACALSLQRSARRRRLSRHLRLQRRRYAMNLRAADPSASPERLVAGHRRLLQSLEVLPLHERCAWTLRCRVAQWLEPLRARAAAGGGTAAAFERRPD